jgi:BioD-like phosphotransacetylase family protein
MKSIYITSVESHSGKTATCLALGRKFQKEGKKVGYFKPLSFQPWRVGKHIADEDAAFVKEVLKLEAEPWELSPVVVDINVLKEYLESKPPKNNMMEKVIDTCKKVSEGVDVMICEGGGTLREGYIVGLPTPEVAKKMNAFALAIVKYRDQVRLLDDALTAQTRLGDTLGGILINRVPEEAMKFVKKEAVPYLEKRGIPVFGVIPENTTLEALTVSEITTVLTDCKILTPKYNPDALVENLTIGAMTAEAALSRFRKQSNKAVITGGDRSDIQLAALETSTTCLILTGNMKPSPIVVKQAEDMGIAVVLVPQNTMETVEALEEVFGKTRLGQLAKLEQFEKLLVENLDMDRLEKALA